MESHLNGIAMRVGIYSFCTLACVFAISIAEGEEGKVAAESKIEGRVTEFYDQLSSGSFDLAAKLLPGELRNYTPSAVGLGDFEKPGSWLCSGRVKIGEWYIVSGNFHTNEDKIFPTLDGVKEIDGNLILFPGPAYPSLVKLPERPVAQLPLLGVARSARPGISVARKEVSALVAVYSPFLKGAGPPDGFTSIKPSTDDLQQCSRIEGMLKEERVKLDDDLSKNLAQLLETQPGSTHHNQFKAERAALLQVKEDLHELSFVVHSIKQLGMR